MSTRISDLLTKLATSPDHQATLLGVVAAALLAGQVNYPHLLMADLKELGKAAGVIVIAAFGYIANKGHKAYPPPAPTPPPPAAGGMSSVTIGPVTSKPPK